jgi:hypothetical protein
MGGIEDSFTLGPSEMPTPSPHHVAWTPEGGLMLAMFQVPNQVF